MTSVYDYGCNIEICRPIQIATNDAGSYISVANPASYPLMCDLGIIQMNGACNRIFSPAPWGLGEGSKGQISLNFSYKDFIQNFVPVLTKIDIKQIKRNFHSMARVMPKG